MGNTQFLMGLTHYTGLQITVLPFAMMCQFIKQYSQISQKVHPFSVFVFQYSRCASQCTALVAAKRGKQEQEEVDCHTVIITTVININIITIVIVIAVTIVIGIFFYGDLTIIIAFSCQYCHSVSSSSFINTRYMYLFSLIQLRRNGFTRSFNQHICSLETFLAPLGIQLSIYTPYSHQIALICVHALRGLFRLFRFVFYPSLLPSATKTFIPAALLCTCGNYFHPYLSIPASAMEAQHSNENCSTINHSTFFNNYNILGQMVVALLSVFLQREVRDQGSTLTFDITCYCGKQI